MSRRLCIEPGCTAVVEGTRCIPHSRSYEAARRADPTLTGRRGTTSSWAKIRKRVMMRDRWTCRCGAPAVHVHHKNGDANNDEMDNLVALCVECHRQAHRELRAR